MPTHKPCEMFPRKLTAGIRLFFLSPNMHRRRRSRSLSHMHTQQETSTVRVVCRTTQGPSRLTVPGDSAHALHLADSYWLAGAAQAVTLQSVHCCQCWLKCKGWAAEPESEPHERQHSRKDQDWFNFNKVTQTSRTFSSSMKWREINWKRLDNTSWVWRNKKKHKKVLQVKD